MYGEKVAHHGERCYLRHAATQRLQQTQSDQAVYIRDEGAAKAGQHEQDKTCVQWRLAPVAIEQRPVEELAAGHADEVARQGQRDLSFAAAQPRSDLRKGGQVEVDGKWRDGAECAKDKDDTKFSPLCVGHAVAVVMRGAASLPGQGFAEMKESTCGAVGGQCRQLHAG